MIYAIERRGIWSPDENQYDTTVEYWQDRDRAIQRARRLFGSEHDHVYFVRSLYLLPDGAVLQDTIEAGDQVVRVDDPNQRIVTVEEARFFEGDKRYMLKIDNAYHMSDHYRKVKDGWRLRPSKRYAKTAKEEL